VDFTGGRLGYDWFQDTPQSGCDNVLNFQAGIALSDRIALECGYAFESFVAPNEFLRSAASSRQCAHGLRCHLVPPGHRGLCYREGDVISYACSTAARYCPVLDRTRSPGRVRQPLRTAYKLLARTHALSFSAAYQLTKYASVQLGYEYAVTRTIRCNTKTIWWKRTSPWRIEMRPSRGFVLLTVLALAGDLLAGSLEVIVKDDKGRRVPMPLPMRLPPPLRAQRPKKHAVVDQREQAIRSVRDGGTSGHRGHFPEQR